jgi:hypothetical protein
VPMLRIDPLALLTWLPLLAGCGPNPQPGTDAGADSSPDSASPPIDGGPLVARCQSLAQNFQTKCAGSDQRPCLWSAYAALCVTGQTQLLIDSMSCLDSTTCRTFSDPNQAVACLAQVHSAGETPAAKSFLESACSACDAGCAVNGTVEIIPYLTDSDLTTLSSCYPALCALFTGADAGTTCPMNADLGLFTHCL